MGKIGGADGAASGEGGEEEEAEYRAGLHPSESEEERAGVARLHEELRGCEGYALVEVESRLERIGERLVLCVCGMRTGGANHCEWHTRIRGSGSRAVGWSYALWMLCGGSTESGWNGSELAVGGSGEACMERCPRCDTILQYTHLLPLTDLIELNRQSRSSARAAVAPIAESTSDRRLATQLLWTRLESRRGSVAARVEGNGLGLPLPVSEAMGVAE